MSSRHFHSSRHIISTAAALSLLIAASGCQMWHFDGWTLDRFRDDRAVEIEQRLDRDEPIVKNPF
jgi:hypothetical protein